MSRKMFIRCELCGKILIERMPNGLWNFSFGRPIPQDSENPTPIEKIAPVRMLIHGSVKIKCLRKSCRLRHPDHWNVLNFFPNPQKEETSMESVSIGTAPEHSGIEVN